MDLEFGVDDPCEQLGAAQVQADRLRGAQGAALSLVGPMR
jgi:hypothetical protein